MPVKLATHADEEGTFHAVCTFADEDGKSCVPITLVWTLSDLDGNVINGRSAVAVAVPATANTITMKGTDLTIVSGQANERLFLIEWTYNSTYGAGLPGKEQATFIIDDLKKVV